MDATKDYMHFFLAFFLHDVFLFVFLCYMHKIRALSRRKLPQPPAEKVNQTLREICKRHPDFPTGEMLPTTEDVSRCRRQYTLKAGRTVVKGGTISPAASLRKASCRPKAERYRGANRRAPLPPGRAGYASGTPPLSRKVRTPLRWYRRPR